MGVNAKQLLSERAKLMPQAKGNFEIYAIANKREIEGQRVIHMEIGRPDFDTPEIIKNAAIEALQKGDVHYTSGSGTIQLKRAIAKREKEKSGLAYDPETEILVTVGASEALYCIWMMFLNPGDEIIMPSPYYSSYPHQLAFSEAKILSVPILKNGKVEINREDFEAVVTPNTKILMINSPNNPTGHVMTEEELQMFADFAIRHDLLVISDECYDNFVFEGTYKSIAALPGMKEQTLVINAASKVFSMTGWRIGYAMGNTGLIDLMGKLHAHLVVCAPSFAQTAASKGFLECYDDVEKMCGEFKHRRDYLARELDTIDDITFVEPKGAFYIFMDVGKLGVSGFEFCEQLLSKKGVAFSPGNAFGLEWNNYVRIAYSCSMEDLKDAMQLMKEYIAEIKA